MEIIELNESENTLKLVVGSNEETLFTLLKVYLDQSKDVEIVGVSKAHHLVDETELHIKVSKSKNPKEVLKKVLKEVTSSLEGMKVK